MVHAAVLVAVGGVAVGVLTGRISSHPPTFLWPAGLFIAVMLASSMTSVDPGLSLKVTVNQVLGLALALSASLLTRQSGESEVWVLRGWTVSALVVLVPALPAAMQASDKFGGTLVEGRVQGTFAQPNDFAEFAIMGLAVAWALAVSTGRWGDRVLGSLGALCCMAGIAVSFSRGAWIATVGLLITALLLAPRLIKQVAALAGAALAVSVAGTVAGIPPFPALYTRLLALLSGSMNPEDDRLLIWRQGLRITAQNPLLGRGPGMFSTGSDDLGSDLIMRSYIHAHNVLLTIAAEMGLLALAALLVLTVVMGWSCLRALHLLKAAERHREAKQLAILGAGLVAIAVHGIVDVVYTNPYLIPLAWLLLGIVAGICARVILVTRGSSSK